MSQLRELSKPFPESLVKQKPGKFAAAFVSHADVGQRLLEVLGPYSFEVKQMITNPDGMVTGCLATLTCTIDGREVRIPEVGDVERPGESNGAAGKTASSDALKRCAMRLGVGLHLWSQDNYYLDRALDKREKDGHDDK